MKEVVYMVRTGLFIDSIHNKTLKEINSLRLKKERDKTGLFLLEGERLVNEIPRGYDVKYIAVSENYTGKIPKVAKVVTIKAATFDKITETVNSQGIVAVCAQPHFSTEGVFECENPLFVVLENITDPGNMGTIIRTADAAGANGIFISKGCVDIFNPKVVRATMGSIFHLPLYKDVDLDKILPEMREHNIISFSAHLRGEKSPYEVDLKKSCAIVVGNEANGLSDHVVDMTDLPVKIPMPGKAESMNAGVAAGILIYEAVRQRLCK